MSDINIFEKNKAFFAFSNSQLYEGIAKFGGVPKDYVNMGAGLICLKENTQQMKADFDQYCKDSRAAKIAEHGGADGVIRYEYHNYETSYTGDVNHLIDMLSDYTEEYPDEFSEENIRRVANQCYHEYQLMD